MARGRRLPVVETDGSVDARAFLGDVASRRGVFVLSSHCGTVEVLSALGDCGVTFHAWMEFSRTSVFNAFYLKHARGGKVVLHPVSRFGPETFFTAAAALDAGDCLVMAGDRGFGRMQTVPFRGGEIVLPEGAFRFARALEHPVYFVACVATGGCRYRAIVRRLPSSGVDQMACAYAAFLDEVTRAYPHQ
jgi:predicted LPLAT superfamily acyltransferase